jgi:hypothetical protein
LPIEDYGIGDCRLPISDLGMAAGGSRTPLADGVNGQCGTKK